MNALKTITHSGMMGDGVGAVEVPQMEPRGNRVNLSGQLPTEGTDVMSLYCLS